MPTAEHAPERSKSTSPVSDSADRIPAPILGLCLGAILLSVGIAAFVVTRHKIRKDDIVEILGESVAVEWRIVNELEDGRGHRYDNLVLTNAEVKIVRSAHGITRIVSDFEAGKHLDGDIYLVSRRLFNIFGVQVARRHLDVDWGKISKDGSIYHLQLRTPGQWEEGLLLEIQAAPLKEKRFVVRIQEKIEAGPLRECLLEFQIREDGTITYLGQLHEASNEEG